jgi:hypothetical protein
MESILTIKTKYFKIPLIEIISRKHSLPLWFVAFLNTYPLTNYSLVHGDSYVARLLDTPVFSPFTLHKHLNIIPDISNQLCIYLNQDEVENTIMQFQKTINK